MCVCVRLSVCLIEPLATHGSVGICSHSRSVVIPSDGTVLGGHVAQEIEHVGG